MKRLLMLLIVAWQFNALAKSNQRNFLWVIDNSGSMQGRREEIAKAFGEFSRTLLMAGLEYNMALTTTDHLANNGELVSNGALKFVSSQSPQATREFETLMNSVQDSPTSFWEQGLESALQTLESSAHTLVMPDVPLSVIYVTDEDDYSCAANCYGVEPENNKDWVGYPLSRYTRQFSWFESLKVPVSIYAIVGTRNSPCEIASVGARYASLQAAVGKGFVESICPGEVTKNIQKIAQDVIAQ